MWHRCCYFNKAWTRVTWELTSNIFFNKERGWCMIHFGWFLSLILLLLLFIWCMENSLQIANKYFWPIIFCLFFIWFRSYTNQKSQIQSEPIRSFGYSSLAVLSFHPGKNNGTFFFFPDFNTAQTTNSRVALSLLENIYTNTAYLFKVWVFYWLRNLGIKNGRAFPTLCPH